VLETVTLVLQRAEQPMQAREIHRAAEQLLGAGRRWGECCPPTRSEVTAGFDGQGGGSTRRLFAPAPTLHQTWWAVLVRSKAFGISVRSGPRRESNLGARIRSLQLGHSSATNLLPNFLPTWADPVVPSPTALDATVRDRA